MASGNQPKYTLGESILLSDCNDGIVPGQSYRTNTSTLNVPFNWNYAFVYCLGTIDSNGTWDSWKKIAVTA